AAAAAVAGRGPGHMRMIAVSVACILAASVPAQAQRVPTSVDPGTNIDWSFEQRHTARYQSGPMTLTFQGRPDAESPDLINPVLRVEIPGVAPVEATGSLTPPSVEHRATVGQWDADRPYVLFQSFSGGAHCCNEVQLILPEDGRLQVVDLGEWDGDYFDELPTDRDGDGNPDFIFVDNAFLYAFASYAESFAPPQIMNVVGGRPVNVSDRPGFRPIFEQAMADARQACLHPEDSSPNGACAAYVASAARVGRFDEAWAEMLRAYDRNTDWPQPGGCRAALVDYQCPDGQEITFDNYPDALRYFLAENGYIER
ncbi:MAG TPA: hypothetical protein VGX37_10630, partial [Allosphingosinicella sp.]|nr:hypothetical protein [Allosphingosinicella sp.]